MRLAQAVGLHVPLAVVNRVLDTFADDSDDEDGRFESSTNITREMTNYVESIITPYGGIFQTLDVPSAGGRSAMRWEIFNPFSLLWWLCNEVPLFAALLYDCCVGQNCKIAFWFDDTTCGNKLRPDARRRFTACYWTICNLPEWWRSCDFGWLPIGFLSYDTLKMTACGFSSLFRCILSLFFTGATSFAAGFTVPAHGKGQLFMRGHLCCFLADEKAHKEVNVVKGRALNEMCVCGLGALVDRHRLWRYRQAARNQTCILMQRQRCGRISPMHAVQKHSFSGARSGGRRANFTLAGQRNAASPSMQTYIFFSQFFSTTLQHIIDGLVSVGGLLFVKFAPRSCDLVGDSNIMPWRALVSS